MRYGLSLWERLDWWRERLWKCEIRRQHHGKMATRGRCYRCGRRVPQ